MRSSRPEITSDQFEALVNAVLSWGPYHDHLEYIASTMAKGAALSHSNFPRDEFLKRCGFESVEPKRDNLLERYDLLMGTGEKK